MKILLLGIALMGAITSGCSTYAVRAYGATGVIIDAKTHEPIYGAAVKLTGHDLGTTTDSEGRFTFVFEREYFRMAGTSETAWIPNQSPYARKYPLLSVEHDGYRPRTVALMELPQAATLSDRHPDINVGRVELTPATP